MPALLANRIRLTLGHRHGEDLAAQVEVVARLELHLHTAVGKGDLVVEHGLLSAEHDGTHERWWWSDGPLHRCVESGGIDGDRALAEPEGWPPIGCLDLGPCSLVGADGCETDGDS